MEIALFILAPIVALGSLALLSISKPKQKTQTPKCTHTETKIINDYWFTEEIQITACANCGKVLKKEHL